MHRTRLLAIARQAVPDTARTYAGHVARWREGLTACPNCNAAKGVTATEVFAHAGERLDANAYPPPPPGDIVRVVAIVCPNCETFTAMEVPT